MEVKKIDIAVFDPETGEIEFKTIEETLKAYYSEINCDLIEFAPFYNGIDLIVDEEGLLKDSLVSLLAIDDHEIMLRIVGKIIFASTDEETGETIGLNEEQKEYIKNLKIENVNGTLKFAPYVNPLRDRYVIVV